MVTQFGMSDELGLRIFGSGAGQVSGWPAPQQREWAEGTALKIDAEIKVIMDRAQARTRLVLQEHWGTVVRFAEALLRRETLERIDIERLLGQDDGEVHVPCAEEDDRVPKIHVVDQKSDDLASATANIWMWEFGHFTDTLTP